MRKESSHMCLHFGVMKASLDMLPEKPSHILQEEFLLLLHGPHRAMGPPSHFLFICLYISLPA